MVGMPTTTSVDTLASETLYPVAQRRGDRAEAAPPMWRGVVRAVSRSQGQRGAMKISTVTDLVVPARFRLVIEGPLEHQLAVLDALRSVAAESDCVVLALAERSTKAAPQKLAAPEDDFFSRLRACST